MPYQPSFPYPNLETIDVSSDITFRCLINPRDVIDKYELSISSVIKNTDSESGITSTSITEVLRIRGEIDDNGKTQKKSITYTTGTNGEITEISNSESFSEELDSILPLYGTTGDNSWLTINIPSGRLENDNEYTWTITLYTGESFVTSLDYYFLTEKAPEINLGITSPITSNVLTLNIPYTEINTSISYYTINLYLDGEQVYTTGSVFSSNIIFEYNKFLNNKEYEIELIAYTDSGLKIESNTFFEVYYNESSSLFLPSVKNEIETGSVVIDYMTQASNPGELLGNQTITLKKYKNSANDSTPTTTNAISLSNQDLKYSKASEDTKLNFNKTAQVLHWRGHPGFSGVIFEKIDSSNPAANITVEFSLGSFYYKIGTNDRKEVPCSYYTDVSNIKPANISEAEYNKDEYPESGVLYALKEDTTLNETDTLVSNDPTNEFWWFIFINSNEVIFIQDNKAVS